MSLVLVCGSRSWTRADLIRERLSKLEPGSTVMHGAARGADTLAGTIARSLDFVVEEYPADWRGQGRRAGVIRNLAMLSLGPERVLAFWDGESTGTAHTMTEARKRGIPVEVVIAA